MKILIAYDFYPPFIGGAERQVQLIGRRMTERGHCVTVATMWHPGHALEHDDAGVRVVELKSLTTRVPWFSKDAARRYHPPFPDPFIVAGLRRLLDEFKPDVVHAQGWIAYSCAAALIGRRTPLLLSTRDYGYSCATRVMLHQGRELCDGPAAAKCASCSARHYGAPKGLMAMMSVLLGRSLLRRKATGVHSISTFVRQVVERDLLEVKPGVQPVTSQAATKTPTIIPSFYDAKNEPPADEDFLRQLPDQPYILYVGALQLHKGLAVLLEAYQRLKSPPPMVVAGTVWPDTPRSFPPGVTVLRNVSHANVMAAWKRSWFGVAPSLWPEPLGAVVFEGMSQGKAIIGTEPSGHADMIVDGETGYLISLRDQAAMPALLAEAMDKLIRDPALCERFGAAGKARMALFTADAVIPRFESLYNTLTTLDTA